MAKYETPAKLKNAYLLGRAVGKDILRTAKGDAKLALAGLTRRIRERRKPEFDLEVQQARLAEASKIVAETTDHRTWRMDDGTILRFTTNERSTHWGTEARTPRGGKIHKDYTEAPGHWAFNIVERDTDGNVVRDDRFPVIGRPEDFSDTDMARELGVILKYIDLPEELLWRDYIDEPYITAASLALEQE